MKITRFARVELPDHKEKTFDDFLLGKTGCQEGSSEPMPNAEHQHKNLKKTLAAAQDSYFRGYYLDGLKYYAKVLSQDPKRIAAWVGQVRILVDVGQYKGAIYWAEKAGELSGSKKLFSFVRALALAHEGRIGEAKTIINVPVGKDESPMMWLLRGEVLIRIRINLIQKIFTPYKGIGRLGAFFCFVKALGDDQYDPFINQRIGLAYLLARQYNRAFECLQASLNAQSDNPLALYGVAECYRKRRDYERALYYVKKAIAGNPNLDCAFELLEWLHNPARRFFRGIKRKTGKDMS
jgi:tetratricopeptide (TPR) repeat protein